MWQWIGLLLLIPGTQGSCEAPAVPEGAETRVTCHFDQDLNATQAAFYVDRYKPDQNGSDQEKERVLECQWAESGRELDCPTVDGQYAFDEKVGSSLTLSISSASQDHVGKYFCLRLGQETGASESCDLKLTDRVTPPPGSASDTGSKVTTPGATETTSSNVAAESHISRKADNTGMIVGVVVACIAVLGVAVVGVVCWCKRRGKTPTEAADAETPLGDAGDGEDDEDKVDEYRDTEDVPPGAGLKQEDEGKTEREVPEDAGEKEKEDTEKKDAEDRGKNPEGRGEQATEEGGAKEELDTSTQPLLSGDETHGPPQPAADKDNPQPNA